MAKKPRHSKEEKKTEKTPVIQGVGLSGGLQRSPLRKWLIVAIVLLFGGIGTYILVSSYADTVSSACKKAPNSAACKKASATTTATNKAANPVKQTTAPPASKATPAATCKPVTHGSCVNGKLVCSNGYFLSGGKCDPVTCSSVANGQKCGNTITCNTNYTLTDGQCSLTCTKELPGGHGKICSDNKTIKCDDNYKVVNGACVSNITCKTIANGKSCSDGTVACSAGFTQDKSAKTPTCAKVTCTRIANGQNCSNGIVTCNPGFTRDKATKTAVCMKLSCKKITNGTSCNDGTVACVSGYTQDKSAKTPTCEKIKCTVLAGGTICGGQVTCIPSYTVVKNNCVKIACTPIPNGQTCGATGVPTTVTCNKGYQVKGSTCVATITCTKELPDGHGKICSDNKTIKCDSGYTLGLTTATQGTCVKYECHNIAHGQGCNNNTVHCDVGYAAGVTAATKDTCVKLVCHTVTHGISCNDNTIHCDVNYMVNKDSATKDKQPCVKITCTQIANGVYCANGKVVCNIGYGYTDSACVKQTCVGLYHGTRCDIGSTTTVTCDVNWTQDGNHCTPVTCKQNIPNGDKCNNGTIKCDKTAFKKDGACVKITCTQNIANGNKCNDGSVKCDNDALKVDGACKKITCKQGIAHGDKCTDGSIKCDNGYQADKAKKHCVADNSVVVAYSGYNDGCGGNATHYAANKTTHVAQVHYGNKSVCICNTGKVVAYGKAISDAHMNPKCSGTTNVRSSGGNRQSGSVTGSNGGGPSTSQYDDCGPSGTIISKSLCRCGSWTTNDGLSTYARQSGPRSTIAQICQSKPNPPKGLSKQQCIDNFPGQAVVWTAQGVCHPVKTSNPGGGGSTPKGLTKQQCVDNYPGQPVIWNSNGECRPKNDLSCHGIAHAVSCSNGIVLSCSTGYFPGPSAPSVGINNKCFPKAQNKRGPTVTYIWCTQAPDGHVVYSQAGDGGSAECEVYNKDSGQYADCVSSISRSNCKIVKKSAY